MVIKKNSNGLKHLEPEFKKTEAYKTLNMKQRQFFKAFFNGDNILLTGPAGTGKSYCIATLFNFLNTKNVFIGKTALTGVAALNIGGSTLHSWAGIGIAEEDSDFLTEKAMKNRKARERIQNTTILFVDEISMASADLLEKCEAVLRGVRYSKEPFGGIQVVFSGDFLQLPPVAKGYGQKLAFAFKSKAWESAQVQVVQLEKLVRQDDTTPFAKVLQKVRFGDTTGLELLAQRVDAELDGPITPIRIFCKNVDINRYNQEKYDKLKGEERTFIAKDKGDARFVEYFERNCPVPAVMKLKVGAQVMLLVNIDVEGGLVNGSMGVITGFSPLGPIVKFTDGQSSIIDASKWEATEQELDISNKMRYRVVASREQIPLKLAYATSVHKQQGTTLDKAFIDVSEAFDFGQVYVALSRVRSLEGLSLTNFSPSKIKAHPDCLEFYKKNKE